MLEYHQDVDSESIVISDGISNKTYQVIQIKDHLVLANDLYNMILEGKDPQIFINEKHMPLFREKLEKSNFSLVLYDFFRFTNVF